MARDERIINLTGECVYIYRKDERGNNVVWTIYEDPERHAHLVRTYDKQMHLGLDLLYDVPIYCETVARIEGLPPVRDGVMYIVTKDVYDEGEKRGREDLLRLGLELYERGEVYGHLGFIV